MTRKPRTGRMPKGWQLGLPPAIIEAVKIVEGYSNKGLFILSDEDEKGYRWVKLCPGHPYASSRHGWQRLHRYLMCRRLGRRLHAWEHCHHKPGAPKDTLDGWQLELLEDVEHGRWHAANRRSRIPGDMRESWCERDERGRFTKVPIAATADSTGDNLWT